jgi:hypothetical protein
MINIFKNLLICQKNRFVFVTKLDVGQLSWFKGKPVVKKSALGGKKQQK